MYKLLVTLALIEYFWIARMAIQKYGKGVILQLLYYSFLAIIGAFSISHILSFKEHEIFSYFRFVNAIIFILSLFGIGHIMSIAILKRFPGWNIGFIFIDTIFVIILSLPLAIVKLLHYPYIDKNTFMPFLQTDIREAFSFLKSIDLVSSLVFIIIIIIVLIFIIKVRTYTLKKVKYEPFSKSHYLLFLNFLIIASLSFYHSPFRSLILWTQEYHSYIKSIYNSTLLDYKPFIVSKEKLPQTLIFIIGESLSRDYMSAYGYPANTTPYLSQYVKDSTLIKLVNSYACETQTILAVPQMITSANQYNSKKQYGLLNILNINKYKTWWLSNQEKIGINENPVSVIAHNADSCLFRPYQEIRYDEELLSHVYNALSDPYPQKAIFIHLMGSHFLAKERYPHVSPFLRDCNYENESLYHYENSVLYNDSIIHEIIKHTIHSKQTVLFYTSDHGDNPLFIRNNINPKFEMLRIPTFVYLSADYKREKPDIYTTLEKNNIRPWSNDLSFDLILGLMNIHSGCYDSTLDISSPNYKLTEDNLKMMDGKYTLKDDYRYISKE